MFHNHPGGDSYPERVGPSYKLVSLKPHNPGNQFLVGGFNPFKKKYHIVKMCSSSPIFRVKIKNL